MAQVFNDPSGVGGTVNVMVPESWTKDVQFARDNAFVAAGLVERKYEKDLSVGDRVHIPFIADLTTETIESGTDLTPVANTETEVELIVDQYEGTAIEIFDQAKVQSKYNLASAYSNRIGQALAENVDSALLGEYANVAAANDMTTAAAIAYDDIVDAVGLLDAGNVPQGDRFLIVNAVTLSDLRKDSDFVRYDARGDKGAFMQGGGVGALGEIYGIPVYLSNNVQTDATPTPDDYCNILAHKSWLGLAIQDKPALERDRNPLGSASYLIGRVLYGFKTIRDDHAVVVRRQV